jgi:hypothetical protein
MTASKFLVFSGLLVVLLALSVVVGSATNGADAAASAINQGEDTVVVAYEAVLDAEHAGANVTGLLAQLNEAGALLAEAQVAFRLGDFDEAVRFADLAAEIGEEVTRKAQEVALGAYGSTVTGSWLTITGSLVGVVAVGFGSFWGWRVFKRRYYQRVLRMQLEVAQAES